jgi:hypothetical protein
MNRNTKIILGVVISLLVVCVCGAVAMFGALGWLGISIGQQFEPDPAKVAQIASKIADFKLPPGYKEDYGVEVADYAFASYTPGDDHSHILLIQVPPSVQVDQAALERQMTQVTQSQSRKRPSRLTTTGTSQVNVRGQSVKFVVSEGTNSEGQAYRQMTGMFQGKHGLVLLTVEEPTSRWNQAAIDAFIASIR